MTKAGNDKDSIRTLFNTISPVYDFLNHFLSFGMDIGWRKSLIRKIHVRSGEHILDAACGTGDLSRLILRKYPGLPLRVTGIDISENMIHKAQRKIHEKRMNFFVGDVEKMPFEKEYFHHVVSAFGVRNLENLSYGLKEMSRVLKEGGNLYILEFSVPPRGILHSCFRFYFHRILPAIGKMISGHDSAYTYLPQSVDVFPAPETFSKMLNENGFEIQSLHSLSGGICIVYHGIKKGISKPG
jgi:demethylmenaquinone methyltransferase / 2-methoxy-6-polyprenyl-1,4-benzoquinol methylase